MRKMSKGKEDKGDITLRLGSTKLGNLYGFISRIGLG
jgi:hypothetical protein